MEHDGITANSTHADWLDSICDRCVMYMAGRDQTFTQGLSDDADFVAKVQKCFGGTMVEARKLLEPVDDLEGDSDESSEA